MDNSNPINIQHRIKENAEDVQSYLLDLASWEKDMQKKDEELKNIKISEEDIPPVRNLLSKGKRKNRNKKQKEKAETGAKSPKSEDKYDADSEFKSGDKEHSSTSECFEDEEFKSGDKEHSSTSEFFEDEDEELYSQKRKQLAVFNKDKGNKFFKKSNFDQAIGCYTLGIELDPDNALLPANRAMAFLKKQQFQAAENDCTLCLSIDPTYVKAYLRRGAARSGLNKFDLAKEDYSKALELEPDNKQASQELTKLEKIVDESVKKPVQNSMSDEEVVKAQNFWPQFVGHKTSSQFNETSSVSKTDVIASDAEEESSIIDPVQKSPSEQSKKPLLQIKIKDVSPLSNGTLEEQPVKMDSSQAKPVPETSVDSSTSVISISAEYTSHTIQYNKKKYSSTLPPVPQTSFQFLSDWKKVYVSGKAYEYLKQFPPEKFPTVFKHSMDTELFTYILETLSTSFLDKKEDVFPYMKYLSEIGRFSTLLMLMSTSERKAVKRILDTIKPSRENDPEFYKVSKRYNVA